MVQAITVRDRAAGAAGLTLSDILYPHAAENDVIVLVYAAGFTPGELDWPGTWTDQVGHDRTPSKVHNQRRIAISKRAGPGGLLVRAGPGRAAGLGSLLLGGDNLPPVGSQVARGCTTAVRVNDRLR